MERIQRALELARIDRAKAESAAGAAPLPSPPLLLPTAAPPRAEVPPVELRRVTLDRAQLESRHVVFPDEQNAAASAYRMLRSQLLLRLRGTRERIIGIVSATDGEGKTLTATNLALSLAADPNYTVLLVDLDLRNPGVAPLLGIEAPRGVESWIEFGSGLDEVCCRVEGLERLLVLPAMRALRNSSDLLAGPRTQQMLDELTGQHSDRILIIDLPPALLANDLLTVSPLLDGVLLVASEGRTQRDDLARLRELLAPVRVLGTILNNASRSEHRAY